MKNKTNFSKIFALAAISFASAMAFAGEVTKPQPVQTTGTDISQQQQQQTTASSVSASSNGGQYNGGNSITQVFTGPDKTESNSKVEYSGTQTLKNVPSVGGPALTTSNDTCMGSASGSANGPGFGVSLAKTYTDENCVMLKNSREMWNRGFQAASMARMCMDEKNKDSFEMTGYICPQTIRDQKMSSAKAEHNAKVEEPQLTDPLARQRMGYQPLK